MSVTVICKFPSACWYALRVQNIVRNNASNQGSISLDDTLNIFESKLLERSKIDSNIVEFIDSLPPLTPAFEKTPAGRILNLVQEAPEPFIRGSRIAFHNDLLIRLAAKIM